MEPCRRLTGGTVMPTIACHMQLLHPGENTRARRRVCCTVEGAGYSIVGGERLDWEDKDGVHGADVAVLRARQYRRPPGLPVQLQRRAGDEGPEPLPG